MSDAHDRVMIWNSIPTTNHAPADLVLGKDSFTDSSSGTVSQSCFTLDQSSISIDNDRVFFVDRLASRVVIFNDLPAANGGSANIVIGQSNFTNSSTNGGGSVSAAGLNLPTGVFARNNKLVISDTAQHRVLIYDNVVGEPNLSLDNTPDSVGNNEFRLDGSASVALPYALRSISYAVNGGGFTGATPKDGSFDGQSEEFYFTFNPTSNQPKDSNGALIDGYTVQVKATNDNVDTEDHLFYFSPFTLVAPSDKSTTSVAKPVFKFAVNRQRTALRDNLDSYRIYIKQTGDSDWQKFIEGIPVDFASAKDSSNNIQAAHWKNLSTNNGQYETNTFLATYSDESSTIEVKSKTANLSGKVQWKVVAVDKAGHTQETGVRKFTVGAATAVKREGTVKLKPASSQSSNQKATTSPTPSATESPQPSPIPTPAPQTQSTDNQSFLQMILGWVSSIFKK